MQGNQPLSQNLLHRERGREGESKCTSQRTHARHAAVDIRSVHAQNAKYGVVAACRAVPNTAKGILDTMTGQPAKSEAAHHLHQMKRPRATLPRAAKSVCLQYAFMGQPGHVDHDGSKTPHHARVHAVCCHGMHCTHAFSRPVHVVARGKSVGSSAGRGAFLIREDRVCVVLATFVSARLAAELEAHRVAR